MTWDRFKQHHLPFPSLGLALDISRVPFPDGFLASMEAPMQRAFAEMQGLEAGAIANPDEGRMVGHYWLRTPSLAPTAAIAAEITQTVAAIKQFAARVHAGELRAARGTFTRLLVIGIGGSALGPQLVHQALGRPGVDRMQVSCLDNTDPDGIDTTLRALRDELAQTLVVVISKSGGTPETRNGQLEAAAAFQAVGLTFAHHAVAITGSGSKLEQTAIREGWLARFPMWDWVGGRTSELSAVGLLPAALQGIDIDAMLAGAAEADTVTRRAVTRDNPAALLALMWYHITDGRGAKDMVVLPYKDRLLLFSRYLQQLVMESLGKELDLQGRKVNQGLTVYGNKGSTDQHAYVQQLRDGLNNFFAVFIEVLADRQGPSPEVEPGVTSGAYLQAFFLGTREALTGNDRASITLTIRQVDAAAVGMLIALFERAVGLYASLLGINAYHQPGVEAGKKAASETLKLRAGTIAALAQTPGKWRSVTQICEENGLVGSEELVFKVLLHVASNPGPVEKQDHPDPAHTLFRHN